LSELQVERRLGVLLGADFFGRTDRSLRGRHVLHGRGKAAARRERQESHEKRQWG
jgi:hypothetical protein